jgi:fumarate reductase flavoprotein subunit
MSVAPPPPEGFALTVPVLIVGAGACGLIAALAAADEGAEVLVLEADAVPSGSTALSAGLIPAAGTAAQAAAGIVDDPAIFAADLRRKAKDEGPPHLVDLMARQSGPTVDWLTRRHGLPFTVVHDFDYPGHSQRRMHGLPSRAGRDLVDGLRAACEAQGIDIVCNRRVRTLYAAGDRIVGVGLATPAGEERIGCGTLVLACNGFGGNREMVRRYMPEIAEAVWFGHDGNTGDAIRWGEALDAGLLHLGAYQGHGNVAHPHGILISWAVIGEGGVQVNAEGRRFWNEAQGYSEAARAVLAQPGGVAWAIFDARIAAIARQFEDFKQAEAAGALLCADTPADLARACGLPADALAETIARLPLGGTDSFGRRFGTVPLAAPFHAVRVTAALFHTQGGLDITDEARVRRVDGRSFANLFAGGGAAVGVSGTGDSGYLSGNGLLAAAVLGHVAGRTAARQTLREAAAT